MNRTGAFIPPIRLGHREAVRYSAITIPRKNQKRSYTR